MIRNTDKSWGIVSILFHWIMAGLFFFQFWLGLTLEAQSDRAIRAMLVERHVSFGFLILFLWGIRIFWAVTSKRPGLPETMQKNERIIARASHWALSGLLLVTPIVGWAIVSAVRSPVPLPISVFGLVEMPRLPLAVSTRASGLWTTMHAFLAYFMLVLSAVHALAAIRHQFTLKDGLLRRMIVPGSKLRD